jgi:hypothetical protein
MTDADQVEREPRRIPDDADQVDGSTLTLLDAHRPVWSGIRWRCGCGLAEPCYGSPDDPWWGE